MPKVVFQGEEQYIRAKTGEVLNVQTVSRSVDGDNGFDKIWLGTILELVEEVGNAKMRALSWMLSHRDAKNLVHATKEEIAAATGVSRATVTTLLRSLREANVISCPRRSVWRLNPNVIWKGASHTRLSVLIQYHDERVDAQPDLFEPAEDLPDNVTAIRAA